jgi:HK97 family phage portal protein
LRLPFRRKALTGTPEVVEALAARQLNPFPVLGGGAQQRIQAVYTKAFSANYGWMYRNSPAVRTVIDLIVRNVGQLDLRLYEEISEKEREPRPEHPAALSLRYPNDTTAADSFIRGLVKDFLIYDNSFALKFSGSSNRQLILQRMPANMVEVVGRRLFMADAYKIHRDDGTSVMVEDPTDMMHWHGEDPDDPRVGIPPLETLRALIAEDAALQQAVVELAQSGLVSPSWVYRPGDAPQWSNEARERFEEDLTNRLRKSNKRPVVLEEGMELKDVGVSPKDAQMLEIRRNAVHQVANIYGVHPALVGLDGDAEQAQLAFYSDVLTPICESFTRQLNLSVLVQEYGLRDYTFEFNLDEKYMGVELLKALTSASGRPVMLTNEARARINLPPVDGGDELVTPANVIIGENPKPSTDIMPIQDPNGPSQEGDHREEPSKALSPETERELARELGMSVAQLRGGPIGKRDSETVSLPRGAHVKATGSQFEIQRWQPRPQADMARQHRYVDEAAGVLAHFYDRQAAFYAQPKNQGKAEFARDRWNRELSEDLERLVRSIVDREGGIYVARLAGDDFDMRQVENYLRAMAVGTARGINRVTAADIAAIGVAAALERAMNERLEVAAASLGTRATVFARTEAAKQAPFPEHRLKVWVANTERHASLNGAAVALDSDWGGISPGSEPHCMCSMTVQ